MREIKFRAWDKMKNIMSDVIMLGGEENWKDGVMTKDYIGSWDRFEIQQFTGLKDKNGKEIYEGDVCKYPFGNIYNNNGCGVNLVEGEVCFNLGAFGINGLLLCQMDKTQVEVIGNIFENPELINHH